MSTPRPVSLAAERAIRWMRRNPEPVDSRTLASAVLSTRVGDEVQATRVLRTAFEDDPRLRYEDGRWSRHESGPEAVREPRPATGPSEEPDSVLLLVLGGREGPGRPFLLRSVAAIRLRGDEVLGACGGDVVRGRASDDLREAVRRTLSGAVPVIFDPPGALAALESWLGEVVEDPVSLRRLGTDRLGLRAGHDLANLAAKLEIRWRQTGDPMDDAEVLQAAIPRLLREGETIADLRRACRSEAPPIDWDRYAFDRAFLRDLPTAPGTYRFFDADDRLLYVGKAKNLRLRVGSYFREGRVRSARVGSLLASLHRIEIEPTGSDLEALLREASAIASRNPERNVQRRYHARGTHASRLGSVLILEPAPRPHVIRATLIRNGVLLDRLPLGPRGGGLRRVARLLEDQFFSYRPGPASSRGTPVDIELIARWIAAHRDRVVAFDPTHLRSAEEVVARLRWFLDGGALADPDGSPILPR